METLTRQQAGQPTGGQWSARWRPESDAVLHLYDKDTLHAAVDVDFVELDVFEHDGREIHVTTDGQGEYQVWDDEVTEYFDDAAELKPLARRRRAISAFTEQRILRAKKKLGAVRELDSALQLEILRLQELATASSAYTMPKSSPAPPALPIRVPRPSN